MKQFDTGNPPLSPVLLLSKYSYYINWARKIKNIQNEMVCYILLLYEKREGIVYFTYQRLRQVHLTFALLSNKITKKATPYQEIALFSNIYERLDRIIQHH